MSVKVKKHSKRKHSLYSPSSAERWMNCLGCVNLIKKHEHLLPKASDSDASLEGTKGHECLEFLMNRFSNLTSATKQALKKWPAEMVSHCVDSARAIMKLRPTPKAKLLIETRVYLKFVSKDLYGTLDYAWIEEGGTLVVADFKYGFMQVSPIFQGEPNPQLMIYACGIAELYKDCFKTVKLAIVQPRGKGDEDPICKEHSFTMRELRRFRDRVKAAFVASKDPTAPLKADAGDGVSYRGWCHYCPASIVCPEFSKVPLSEAGVEFDIDTGTKEILLPAAGTLDPNKLPRILDACDKLSVWIDQVRELAKKLAEGGTKIKGRKLVDNHARREWMPDAEKDAIKAFGSRVYAPKEFLSPAQLEKLGSKEKAFVSENTIKISSGYTLVKESDNRQEVTEAVEFDL